LAHSPAFVNNFFKNFFALLLISQQQLYYVTTVAFVCQQFFFIFFSVGWLENPMCSPGFYPQRVLIISRLSNLVNCFL
ncbi:hypothetical protein, partial [Enterocloster lavalensis]|uniref:hypothetical protein n=1 Tax=Enterocloster lavalensis TaxID=460384 RepID=UPI001A9A8DA1